MGAGTSVQEPARPGPPDSPGEEEKSQREAGDQHPAGGAGGKSVQKNGQISGIQGDVEDPKALDSKSEQLNGIQEEIVAREAGPGDLVCVSGGEEMEEMELNEKEVPVEIEGGEQKEAQERDELPTETGEPAEEVQAAEIGFKKVFKFVGLKFTMKKEKPVKSEPVQLLTVTREEGGVAGEAASESKQGVEGSTEVNASPADEGEGSPPEILSPEKAEECTEQEETKMLGTEEAPATVESGANAAESPVVESPLKRFFKQGFFFGLRRKQSFKKAKDEPLLIGEKTEANGERAGDAGSEVQPSTSQEAAEVLAVQSPEEHGGGEEEDFEDLTAELTGVTVASEAPAVAESETPEVKEGGAPAEQSLAAADLGTDQQIPSTEKLPEGQAGVESPATEASAGLQPEHQESAQEQPSVTNSEPVSDEGELVASQRPKQQGSPLKKLFTSSSIKKLSAKKAKGKREETRAGDADDEAKLQSSTESEGSPDSNKPGSPPAFPEAVGEGIPAEVAESGQLPAAEQEEANGAADAERKKEPVTAWASFKKLVTPRKRPKGPLESDRDDELTDKAKSATVSSAESAASEKQEEPKSNGEEAKLERSTEDPKKKADAPVTWEALICVGASKRRTRKASDAELQKSNEEAQGSEANGQVQDRAEEVKVGSPQGPDLEQGGTSPECAESPVEGEASDGVISTWESFKRLVTPRRKSRSKLEERGEESVPSPEAALPEAEPAKEESWASLKKLIPGRRKRRSDIKPEQLQAEPAGKDAAQVEFTGSKSEEESSETPAVVPLSEYDAVDKEREGEQSLKAGIDAVQVADGVLATSEAPQPDGQGVGQTSAGERGPLEAVKSSVDERSPSWISAAVSDVMVEEEVEDKAGLAEETVAVQKQKDLVGEPTPEEGVGDLSPEEVAEEAQEVLPKVAVTSDYPAEESFTEETTEMVSAVSQLTETPVTTAEGTPIREDEAVVSRQTQEVLEEAAQKVKLSVDPIVSCCQVGAPPGTQGDGPGPEPDISPGKSPGEGVRGSSETQAAEPAEKAAKKITEVTIVGPPLGGDVLAGPGEATEQETRAAMQEIALVQGIAPAAVEQELKPVAAPEGDRQPPPLAECQVVDESMTATTVSMDGALLVQEMSSEKVEIVQEQTLEAGQREEAEETEVVREQSVKIAEEGDQEELWATVLVTEKAGAEQIAECRKTEVVPAHAAGKDEAAMEQVGDATSETAQRVGLERVEPAAVEDTENVPDVGAERALTECMEDAGVREIPVEQSVTETVRIEETGQISPPEGVSQVETSEEHAEVTLSVSVTEVLPGEGPVETIAVEETKVESRVEPSEITSAVGVTEVVCGEEMTLITPVGITEAVLGEEPIEIIPVVGVTEAICSEETTELLPVGVTEAILGEEPIEIVPTVGVTEVMFRGIGEISPGEVTEMVRSQETTELTPVGVAEALLGQEPTDITPAVGVTEAFVGEETTELTPVGVAEALLGQEPTDVTPAAGITEAICSEETTELTPVGVAEALLGKDPIEIIPAVGVTEAFVGEETTELTPVGVAEALLGQEPTDVTPAAGITEAICSEETTELTPVGVAEALLGKDPIEIIPAVGVTEAFVGEETTELTPVGVTEALLGKEPTEIPVGVTEALVGEGTTELTPVGVAEAPLGQEPTDITPAAGITEAICSEETTELTPVGVTEALLGKEPIEIIPAVGVTEAVCSEETTEITPVGVTEAVLGEEPTEIAPAVEVIKVMCRGMEIAPEGATAAVCCEKTTEITPVGVTEIISGEQPAGISPLGATDVVSGEEPIDFAPAVEVTEVVCSEETTEITPAVVSESLPSEEPIRITPTVGMTEAVCSEETTELAPLGVTKVIPIEEAFGIAHVTVTKALSEEAVKVSSVNLSEALPDAEQVEVAPVGVTEVCGEEAIEIAAVVLSEVADTASAEEGVEVSKSEREGEAPQQGANERTEEDVQKVMDSETAQKQLTPVESVQQDMGAETVKTAMDEAVCEELVESPKGQRTQEALAVSLGSATQILQSTTTERPSNETSRTTTTEVASTEVESETVCDELEGMKSVQPAAEERDTTLATVSRDQGETSPGDHPEKLLMEPAETQAGRASAARQVETEATCVTSELLSATSEGMSLEQALDVVESAEEVGCKLASEERDKPAPDESTEKISIKAGELGQADQLAVTSQVQSADVPKPCQHTEGAAELQSDVELKSSSSDSLVKEQPLVLSAPQTPVGFSKEKCEIAAETTFPTLESASEVKLHVASVDEFQVLQNEMVTLMEDLPVVKSSESCEEAFPVTVSSVEEKLIAETVTTVAAEIPEPSPVDQVLPPCEDVKQVSVVETAAVIVETAIEVATGCVSSTPDDCETGLTTNIQKAESCRKDQLEDQLAECKIKQPVTQKLECLEPRTEVEVSQTQTFDQQSAQAAQGLSEDPLVLTQLQGKESTKEEEKLLRLQKDTAIEGTSEVIDQRFQTSGNQDFEGKEKVLMQSADMVLEKTVRGGQELVETETLASMHTEQGRESSDDTPGNISVSSEVTRAECCQSLEQPETTHPSIELTEQTQLATIQQISEEQTYLHDAQGGMISLTEELANENEVETVQFGCEAMDQSQSPGTDEKQRQEVETEPSAVKLAKGVAEGTPS